MYWGFGALLALDGGLIFSCVLFLFQKTKQNELRFSKAMLVFSQICAAAAIAIGIYCLGHALSVIALVLDLVFSLLGCVFLFVYCRWRVNYGDGQFFVRPCFKHKRVHLMNEVCGITEGVSTTTLHLQNGNLRLNKLVVQREGFLEEVEWYYRSVLHRGYALPDVQNKLFKNYVKDPVSFIVAFLLVDLFLIGANVLSICLVKAEMNPQEDALTTVMLSDYTVQWKNNALYVSVPTLRQPFYLNEVRKALPENRYSKLCDVLSQNAPILILVEKENYANAAQNNCNYIKIKAINNENGTPIVLKEDVSKSVWLNFRFGVALLPTILFLILCFEGFFCFVISRAPKYPRLFCLLVKENWRNI